ncbi:MAG: carbohydrate binding family 9 domain-containing protein [Candidatus Latescibacteria bacterium]|nr:carbohydrate binding family 9 domain-containing protein [Candidatus Latescibacterota bacterium]
MSAHLTLFKTFVVITASIILPLISSAQNLESEVTEPIKIPRINSPVTLDGMSDEAAWEGIESLPMVMMQPIFGSEPSERTEILLGYDDDYIYAAGRFHYSDISEIQAASFKRDFWHWSSDFMGILLDTFMDNENGVMFLTTPAGTRTDLNILNDLGDGPMKDANPSWNTFWDVATVCNDDGWFSEMRLPFSSLRFEENNGQVVMGLTAHRWISRKNESDTFPLIPQKFGTFGTYKPSQTQEILFEGIKRPNPLYITPYVLGGSGQSNDLNEAETAYRRDDEFAHEAGLDVKYGLTNNLTLDVTLNTDFAQVEADDQKINLTRYSLFFPEKRLFFQERSGNFDFSFEDDNRLFYSRRIGLHEGKQVRIYGGARLVGRAGPWDIGFLNMQTERFEELTSENFNVLRLRKQVINPYSYVGGMVTSRIGSNDSWNTAYGIDGIFRLFEDGDDYLTLKWAQSFEDNEKNKPVSLEPSKIYVNWDRRSEKGLGYNLSYSISGDDFNPGIGYERRDNFTRLGDRVQYGWFPGEESKLLNHQAFIEGITFIRNDDSAIESSEIGPGWQFVTKANTYSEIMIKQYQENVTELFSFSDDADVPAGKYTFYGIEGEYYPFRGNPYRIGTTFKAGSFYDGRRITMTLNPRANISAHLQLEGMYQLNRVEFPDRNQKFTGHIGRLRTLAFLNVKHSLIAFIQYNSANDKIITNLRYRYNPREGNDFYLVYDENYNTDREREIPVLPVTSNRTVMLKYSYTFNIGL